MKRGKRIDPWYPFFIDKWLFGSTRLELIIRPGWRERWPGLAPLLPDWVFSMPFVDLRGIFQDLLTLSKKDGGYIRANDRVPYPHEMLAGQWGIPVELLDAVIKICLHKDVGKMSEPYPGIYYIESTEDYSLSDRHVRRIEGEAGETGKFGPLYGQGGARQLSGKSDGPSEKEDARGEERKGKDIGSREPISLPVPIQKAMTVKEIEEQFDRFWDSWPAEGKHAKIESRRIFIALCKKGELNLFRRGCRGYSDYIASQKERGFDQRVVYAKTFLNGRWKDYLEYKRKPKL